jgi:hypothetical protein
MAEDRIVKPKDPDMLRPLDPNTPQFTAKDAEAEREGKVWNQVCNARGLNADMLVRMEHTDTTYVFVVDKEHVLPCDECGQQRVDHERDESPSCDDFVAPTKEATPDA